MRIAELRALAATVVAALLVAVAAAFAQSPNTENYFYTPSGSGVNGAVGMCLNASSKAVPCSDPSALARPSSLLAATTGGATTFQLVAAATTNSTLISAGAHTVYSAQLGGIGTGPAYVKFYDKATAPTCNSDTVIKTLIIPAAATAALGSGSNVPIPLGFKVTLGLGICVTSGIANNDNTAVAAATYLVNIDYK